MKETYKIERKTVKKEVFEINASLLSKTQITIYNKVIKKYRFWQTYDFLKFVYKNKVYFSDIFMKELFHFLIKINQYSSKIMPEYYYITYF